MALMPPGWNHKFVAPGLCRSLLAASSTGTLIGLCIKPSMACPEPGDTLVGAALKVLCVGDPWKKAEFTHKAVDLWRNGSISVITAGPEESQRVPDRPHRADDKVKLVEPRQMPKLGKGGTLASRQALLHSLAHIENWAIDLSWDIIARFGGDPTYELPREFFDDFVKVAAEECSHFCSLAERLETIGSYYGELPAHDGLWESAFTTARSLPARLAVEHCVHEARGLDVLPNTVHKFRSNGDEETAALLWDVIYAEEVSHCAAGVRWLKHLHKVAKSQQAAAAAEAPADKQQITTGSHSSSSTAQQCSTANNTHQHPGDGSAVAAAADDDWPADAQQYDTVEEWFHALIRRHFKGNLKPPFNDTARAMAGFGPEWYLPLSVEAETRTTAAARPDAASQPAAGAAGAAAGAANDSTAHVQAAQVQDGRQQ